MLALVEEHGFMRVADLSDMFGVSEVTVRSDLDQLVQTSLVDRIHGGAMTRTRRSANGASYEENEPSFEESADTLADEKAAIGRAAASLVSSGDSIIIDVGTTTTAVAHALTERADLDDVVVLPGRGAGRGLAGCRAAPNDVSLEGANPWSEDSLIVGTVRCPLRTRKV